MNSLLRPLAMALAALLASAGVSQANVFWNTNGDLRFTDPRDSQGKHFHLHPIFLEAGKNYILEMNSPHFDTFLRLQGPNGFLLAQNDDGGAALNSKITFRPLFSGMYRLVATSFSPGATGHYELRARRLGGFLPGKIILNVEGDLRFTDPVIGGKHLKSHLIFLQAGREYVITMNSPHFDTFLRVHRGIGPVLAQNDDGGPGLNSRIVFRPVQSGLYRIVATSFRNGATGEYRLVVRE